MRPLIKNLYTSECTPPGINFYMKYVFIKDKYVMVSIKKTVEKLIQDY